MRKTQRLDAILKRRGWVTDAQIQIGLRHQQRGGRRWGSTLVELGIITETQLADALAEQFGTPVWDPCSAVPDSATLKLFPGPWVKTRGVLPLAFDPGSRTLKIAMSDPNNMVVAEELRLKVQAKLLVIVTAPQATLARLWKQFYGLSADDDRGGQLPNLSLDFGITPEKSVAKESTTMSADERHATRVLLWLSQPFVTKLLRSILEFERCSVGQWDGHSTPEGQWDYLLYDEDNALSHPENMTKLKRAMPRLQLVARPSWTSSLLRSPLSYERLRDGYLQLAEIVRRWDCAASGLEGRDASRYALAMARLLPMSPFEVDTLLVACELIPVIQTRCQTHPEHEALAREMGCPYPLVELMRGVDQRFDQTGMQPGQSAPDAPFAARVYAVVEALMREKRRYPVKTIEDAGMLSETLRRESGKLYDPMAVEALLRVVREEILEGYLPPGPSEVLLVSDHPVEWAHLILLLENEGWRVVVAGGAAEARTLTARRKPDATVWAASGAIEWVRWQSQSAPGVANFLILEEFDSALARAALESGYEDVWAFGSWDAGVAATKLRKAVQRRPSGPLRSEAVTGTLSQLSFIDMVQILAAGTRSVKLELHHDHDQATVVVWQGQIKYAETSTLRGEEAVYDIISWHDATFSFSPLDTPPETNCRTTNEAMLMEGCRLLDERKRDETKAKVAV